MGRKETHRVAIYEGQEKPSRQKCVDSIDFAKKYTITKAYMHKTVYSIRIYARHTDLQFRKQQQEMKIDQ